MSKGHGRLKVKAIVLSSISSKVTNEPLIDRYDSAIFLLIAMYCQQFNACALKRGSRFLLGLAMLNYSRCCV